jgi:SAM-dependent methyltransferase
MNLVRTNVGYSYSQIITPADYNRIVTYEHLYIDMADRYLVKKIKELVIPSAEVVELGCGPARALQFVSQIDNINLSALDVDQDFLNYARKVVQNTSINIIAADVETYKHPQEVDIFYSHGLHHHIEKGQKTHNYLKNVYQNLKSGGYYILIDEFIPHYTTPEEREIRIVIWYAHVIAHALRHHYLYLAQEESKILLDDLYEGRSAENIKSQEQIDLVLERVVTIDQAARQGKLEEAEALSKAFLLGLEGYHNLEKHGDLTIDLSRGDFKISDQALKEEVKKVGFIIEEVKAFGQAETIGSVSVYVLKKGARHEPGETIS